LQRWAFLATVILEGVNLILGIVELTQPHPSLGAIIGGIILPAVILVYFLLDANVRAAFDL
jgi:hypothetical protein